MQSPTQSSFTSSRRTILTAFVGLLATLTLLLILALMAMRRHDLTDLTEENASTAQAAWRVSGIDDYWIQTEVQGKQPAVYEVEVRGGKVIQARCNGNPLTDSRTMGTWSVPGMFSTITADMKRNANRGPTDGQLALLVDFDDDFGFPRRYLRSEWGTHDSTSWQVISFTIRNGKSPAETP